MKIESKIKNYTVDFKSDYSFINKLILDNKAFFIIDMNVFNLYKETAFSNLSSDNLFLLEAIEENKNIDTVLTISKFITNLSAKRNIHLVSIGGGITQDITGFIANILYRGVKWTFIPTTLLSACDSCIGGKTSLNFGTYKNLFGTFYPPNNIYICTNFFKTLSKLDYFSGLGEVIKFNILGGNSSLKKLDKNIELLKERDLDIINNYTEQSLRFKKEYIEDDEFDNGKRIYLNFAHTFGHAIEATSKYQVPHGIAVVIGLLMANHISMNRNKLSKDVFRSIESLVKPIVVSNLKLDFFVVERIVDAIKNDKKQTSNKLTCILLNNDFSLDLIDDLQITEVNTALSYIIELFGVVK